MAPKTPPAVGIDLGTTYSVVAYLDAHGEPRTIANSEGDPWTPSVVLFEDDVVTVGKEAQKAASLEPDKFANFAKRDMGDEFYHREIAGQKIPPEVIQSMILRKCKHDAEIKLGPIQKAVITVPAYFNEPRRKATQDAGQLAGLQVIDIINEPTAAAIAYGREQGFLNERGETKRTERILVYDLGGGTFDVTLMEINGKDYNTIATAGDVHLGGIDWDQRLVDCVAKHYRDKFKAEPRKDPAALQRLLREAEDVKRALSSREKTVFTFEHLSQGIRVPITREQFESLTEDLMQRTIFTAGSLVKQSPFEWKEITRVLLVGGSTRMPIVKRSLEKEFGVQVDQSLSTDEAVAHGAAIYAGMLLSAEAGIEPQMSITNVNSHNLGILGRETETGRPKNAVIIPKNTPLPVTKGKRFQTGKDGQRSVKASVIEGGNASGQNSTPIGDCVVRDLPAGLPAGTAVEVFFTYARNGRMTVRARVPSLDKEAVLSVQRQAGLSDEKLQEWQGRLGQVKLTIEG